jgi:translation elongation factor EF-4
VKKSTIVTAWTWNENGITIKSHAIQMEYKAKNILDLIDTPGHVDFSVKFLDLLPLVKGLLIEMQHKAYKHKSILSFRK